MSHPVEPLVSILTPVYNGEKFLAQCIESVLAQTYDNWEYIIVNNHSTDATLEIAEAYARKDGRLRIYSNDKLLPIIANHNRAFRLISPQAAYCKVVSADDWLYPDCLTRLVEFAESHPSVGIVGSYQLSGGGDQWSDWQVKWTQIPHGGGVFPGRTVGRIHMLGGVDVFGTPTSLLYRADLVREHDRFYPNETAEADTSACCRSLQTTDYGFVYQVLSYERVHHVRTTTRSQSLNAYLSSNIGDLLEYGSSFLSAEECQVRLAEMFESYYDFLAISALKRRDGAFWAYHKRRLSELGYPLNRVRLAKAIIERGIGSVLHPVRTMRKIRTQPAALARRPRRGVTSTSKSPAGAAASSQA